MHRFILCLCLLVLGFSTSRANAEPQPQLKTLITFDEFKALDSERQDRYIEGLQALFRDWSKLQANEKLQFQNVGLSRPGSAFAALTLMFGDALAANVDQRRCVYAGYVSEMDVNGRYCMSREACPGRRGEVKCNPLVYGEDVCAPQGKTASSVCSDRSSRKHTTADIKAYVLAHPREFATLRADLTEVCTNGKQASVCQTLQFRVGQMYDQVKDQLPEVASAPVRAQQSAGVESDAPPGSIQRPRGRRPTAGAGSGGADGEFAPAAPVQAARPVQAQAAPAPVPNPAVVEAETQARIRPMTVRSKEGYENFADKRPKNCPKFGNRCQVTSLMQPLAGPQDNSWAGKTLMSLEEAQQFYCRTEPINPEFLTATRSYLKMQQAKVRGTSVVYDNCKEKRDKQKCIRNTNDYYQCYFKQMEDNFEACYAEAQSNRAVSRVPSESAVGAVLTERGGVIDMRLTGSAEPLSTTTVESYLGLLFGMYKVDLCKVQKSGTSAPAQNSAPATSTVTPPGTAGSGSSAR